MADAAINYRNIYNLIKTPNIPILLWFQREHMPKEKKHKIGVRWFFIVFQK